MATFDYAYTYVSTIFEIIAQPFIRLENVTYQWMIILSCVYVFFIQIQTFTTSKLKIWQTSFTSLLEFAQPLSATAYST